MSLAVQIDRRQTTDTTKECPGSGERQIRLKRALHLVPSSKERLRNPGKVAWDVLADDDVVGQIGLDFEAEEFEPHLSKYGPALRIAIDRRHRGQGFATLALGQLMDELTINQFDRPLLAAHDAADPVGARLLCNAGFIHTGCRSRAADGHEVRHMIKML